MLEQQTSDSKRTIQGVCDALEGQNYMLLIDYHCN